MGLFVLYHECWHHFQSILTELWRPKNTLSLASISAHCSALAWLLFTKRDEVTGCEGQSEGQGLSILHNFRRTQEPNRARIHRTFVAFVWNSQTGFARSEVFSARWRAVKEILSPLARKIYYCVIFMAHYFCQWDWDLHCVFAMYKTYSSSLHTWHIVWQLHGCPWRVCVPPYTVILCISSLISPTLKLLLACSFPWSVLTFWSNVFHILQDRTLTSWCETHMV